MAFRKRISPQTAYRNARATVAQLEADLLKEARRRPKSPQAKGWKTRRVTAIERSLRAHKGNVTKARKKIAAQTATKRAAAKAAIAKRSEAAREGWARSFDRAFAPAPAAPTAGYMPFLTENGWFHVLPLGDDRRAVGRYYNAVGHFLDTGDRSKLEPFVDRSIFDAASQRRLPFVTDPDTILRYADAMPDGFYKTREEARLVA